MMLTCCLSLRGVVKLSGMKFPQLFNLLGRKEFYEGNNTLIPTTEFNTCPKTCTPRRDGSRLFSTCGSGLHCLDRLECPLIYSWGNRGLSWAPLQHLMLPQELHFSRTSGSLLVHTIILGTAVAPAEIKCTGFGSGDSHATGLPGPLRRQELLSSPQAGR